MKVTLKAKTDLSVSQLASHAARVCYSINPETLNQPIDIKTRLFDAINFSFKKFATVSFPLPAFPLIIIIFIF